MGYNKLMKKGFTLIELLIVVAIIGILAAVGAAVIPNILKNAKKNAAIANHQTVVDFIKTSLVQCDLGEAKVMITENFTGLDCPGKTPRTVIVATGKALSNFAKNPYGAVRKDFGDTAIREGCTPDSDIYVGYNCLETSNNNARVATCFQLPCKDVTSENVMRTFITVE